jgi:hypothetical protein
MDERSLNQLIDGYQLTLARARETFGDGLESKVVIATVAENARMARQGLVTAVPGGDALVGRLDTFLQEAEKMDVVGRWLKDARAYATGAAKKLIGEVGGQALGLSAAPMISGIIGLVLTVSGVLHGIGRAIGGGIAVLVLGLIYFASRYPHVIVRGAQIAPSVAKGLGSDVQWATNGFLAAVQTADNLGRGAEALLEQSLAVPARAFFGGAGLQPPGWDLPPKVRGIAKTILYSVVGFTLLCGVIMCFGIVEGFSEGVENAPCPTFQGEICP